MTEQWRTDMQLTHTYVQLCIASDDFSYFDARRALAEKAPAHSRYLLAMVAAGPPVVLEGIAQDSTTPTNPALGNTSIEATQKIQESFDSAQADLQNDANNIPKDKTTVPAWKQNMRQKVDRIKKQISDKLDEYERKAEKAIENLPEPQRKPEADKWVQAQDWIMNLVNKMVDALNQMWQWIQNAVQVVLGGIISALKTMKEFCADAFQKVADTASEVVNKLKGIFS
jgi:hypothetical protein